ncbi:hypothetical protein [Chryseobacterium sp. WLY505]|uniref:hypothetical protein n=1 Tax=Chryseobacterium sp. WLY505 TaxID=3068892 RepID=UPI002796B452|nr:hypothetical protein [Chryseobacterium sp. WLY505]MDQ1855771.1 hypothetical protein [Chryseobacterium sp. WLY505]
MLDLNSHNLSNSKLPVITDNYTVLHFDEYPILFSGTNAFGNKIIGSFCEEDYENDTLIYFSIIVSDEDYSDFFRKKISYRKLIINSSEIFIIEKSYNNKILASYILPIHQIPLDYLPMESSFIPDKYAISDSISYSFKLKGKLTDLHKAIVSDVNNINSKIYDYLSEALQTLNVFGINPKVYSQPSTLGSYRLNYYINFTDSPQLNFFEVDQEKVSEFVNLYFEYISKLLPYEKDGFIYETVQNSENFLVVKNSFESIFTSSHQEPLPTVSDILIDGIGNVAEKLVEVSEFIKTNDSFNSIEVETISDGRYFSHGSIDINYKELIETKLSYGEVNYHNLTVESDSDPQPYRILVRRINTETGKGGGRLYPDDTENYHKISLTVHMNQDDLSNSIFTKSLNENKVVSVNGIGTRIDGVYKKLDCYL